jgi:hypothetical protein
VLAESGVIWPQAGGAVPEADNRAAVVRVRPAHLGDTASTSAAAAWWIVMMVWAGLDIFCQGNLLGKDNLDRSVVATLDNNRKISFWRNAARMNNNDAAHHGSLPVKFVNRKREF